MFREKLLYEIQELHNVVQGRNFHDQRIQAHIYCIAALLRKILSRLENASGINIKVYESGESTHEQKDRSVSFLLGRVVHYAEFLPEIYIQDWATESRDVYRFFTILSDWDQDPQQEKLHKRRINIEEFLAVAKSVAENDNMIVGYLLQHTKKVLEEVIPSPSENRLNETEALESLIDFFDLVRAMDKEDTIEGEMVVYNEVRDGMTLLRIDSQSVEYKTLFRHLFQSWHPIPFRPFQQHHYPDGGTIVQGRTLEVHPDTKDMPGTLMIKAEDLLDLLNLSEKQFPV